MAFTDMATRELTISIPASLATEAEANGLLEARELERLLRDELRRRRAGEFIALTRRLAVEGDTAMTLDEVEAEVAAARRERRESDACGR